MSLKTTTLFTAILLVTFASCQQPEQANTNSTSDNILLAEWTGPYGGVPAFDKMDISDVQPAMEEAMAVNLKEIDAIAESTEAPTFENTIVAMERSGKELNRAFTYYGI